MRPCPVGHSLTSDPSGLRTFQKVKGRFSEGPEGQPGTTERTQMRGGRPGNADCCGIGMDLTDSDGDTGQQWERPRGSQRRRTPAWLPHKHHSRGGGVTNRNVVSQTPGIKAWAG